MSASTRRPRASKPTAPAHHFEATGQGTISGRVDLLVELKRELRARFPLIKAEDIDLKLA